MTAPVHPLPPALADPVVAPFGLLTHDPTACVCRWCEEGRATIPPPVRVVRLAGGPEAFELAEEAAGLGRSALDYARAYLDRRGPDGGPGGVVLHGAWGEELSRRARLDARDAAHLARLAMGVSS